MSKRRLTGRLAAAAVGIGAGALLAMGPASAQPSVTPTTPPMPGGEFLTLSPTTVAPGGTVFITMGCDIEVPGAGVTSAITGTTILHADSVGPASFNYSGSATVPAGTTHGTYEFTGGCGSPAFLVVGPGGTGPAGGTGLDSDNDGLIAAGVGALAAAGVGAGGFWLLRRRREADAPVG
jgi:hypothetical protein